MDIPHSENTSSSNTVVERMQPQVINGGFD